MARCQLPSTTRTLATRLSKKSSKKPLVQRGLSTSTVAKSSPTNGNAPSSATTVISSRQVPLTLLHKTSKVLPQVLQYGPTVVQEDRALKFDDWERILARVYDDLSSTTPRPIRLAVHGLDEHSGSEDFVTALLSNPLGSNQVQAEMLRHRWKDVTSASLTISYGPEPVAEGSKLELSTPYLRQFPVPVQVTELRPSSSRSKTPTAIPDNVLASLFEADIPILLCNPLTTSLQSVLSTPLPSNTIVVIASTPSQTLDLEALLSTVPKHAPKPTLIVADPKRAADAITLLQSSPASSSVVQQFQDAFNGSNVSAVTRALQSMLHYEPSRSASSKSGSKPESPSDALRARFALARLQDALSHCRTTLSEIKALLNTAFVDASHLNDKVEEVRARVELEFLGPAQPSSSPTPTSSFQGKPRQNEVAEALRTCEGFMKVLMTRLTWWRMVVRVDEITTLIAAGLHQSWCPELERKLLVHTGELQSIQNELDKTSFDLLSQHRILPTNVLRNSLLQIEASPQHRLTTNSLTAPIHARRDQIIEYPTARLHVTAQRAVLGMSGGVVGGAGLGWVGWMGWLVGSGEGLLGSLGLEPATAMGLGALTAVVSVRWGVGRWEKGKRKWWDDWRRVGDGLDRDLRVTLDRCIQQQVGGISQATAKGFTTLIAQREKDVRGFREEVERLEAEIEEVRNQPVDRK